MLYGYPESAAGNNDRIGQVDEGIALRIGTNVLADLSAEDLPYQVQFSAEIPVLFIRDPRQDLGILDPILWFVILHLVFESEMAIHELLQNSGSVFVEFFELG